MKAIVIAIDTKIDEYTNVFLESLNKNGWEYKILGIDEIWGGFIWRMKKYVEHLSTLESEQICIISDSKDVICTRTPFAFERAFENFKSDIIVSTELFCNGKTYYNPGGNCTNLEKYWKSKGINPDRKFVNAGLICGLANKLIEMYEWSINWCYENKIDDDQMAIGEFMNLFPEKVTADYEAKILHTSTFGVSAGCFSIKQTNDSPTIAELLGYGSFFLHIPGVKNFGQNYIYNICKFIVENNFSGKEMRGKYGWNDEPQWNKSFFEEK